MAWQRFLALRVPVCAAGAQEGLCGGAGGGEELGQTPALSLGLALLWSTFHLSHSLPVSLSVCDFKNTPNRWKAPMKQLLVSLILGSSVKPGDKHSSSFSPAPKN